MHTQCHNCKSPQLPSTQYNYSTHTYTYGENHSGMGLVPRLGVTSITLVPLFFTFLVALNFTKSSMTLATAMSMGSMAPRWIHFGMVVRACLNPSVCSSQSMWGSKSAPTVVRRWRWGLSSQWVETNWRWEQSVSSGVCSSRSEVDSEKGKKGRGH